MSIGGAIFNKGTINTLNAKFEGIYVTSNGESHGAAIYSEANLIFNMDNVDILMSDNNVQVGEEIQCDDKINGTEHLRRINVIVGDNEHLKYIPDDEKEYVVQIIKAKKQLN